LKIKVFTTASGLYRQYIPVFSRCIEIAYPNYEVDIMELDEVLTPYEANCRRFVHEPSGDWDYCYVTDVDMMILREDPMLHEIHLAEMKETGLCYSNIPRSTERRGTERLTGLHFASREWYRRTAEVRKRYENMIDAGAMGNRDIDDELMLMQICRKSGLKIDIHRPLIKRHHGIHLGTIRGKKDRRTYQEIKSAIFSRVTSAMAAKWQEILLCGVNDAIATVRDPMVKWQFEILDKLTRVRG
jgi:hypothetical protein